MSVLLILYFLLSVMIQRCCTSTEPPADPSTVTSVDPSALNHTVSFKTKPRGPWNNGQNVEIVCEFWTQENRFAYTNIAIQYIQHGNNNYFTAKKLNNATVDWKFQTQTKYMAKLAVNWTVDITINPVIECRVWWDTALLSTRDKDYAMVNYTLQFKGIGTTTGELIPTPTDSFETLSFSVLIETKPTQAMTDITPTSFIRTNTTSTNTTGTDYIYPILAGITFLILLALVAGLIYYCMKNRKHKDIENPSVDYRNTARVKGNPRILINGAENQTIEKGPNNIQMSQPAGTEGLVYAELDLDKKEKNEKKKGKNLKPVVHGTENMVEYASLDWNKK